MTIRTRTTPMASFGAKYSNEFVLLAFDPLSRLTPHPWRMSMYPWYTAMLLAFLFAVIVIRAADSDNITALYSKAVERITARARTQICKDLIISMYDEQLGGLHHGEYLPF